MVTRNTIERAWKGNAERIERIDRELKRREPTMEMAACLSLALDRAMVAVGLTDGVESTMAVEAPVRDVSDVRRELGEAVSEMGRLLNEEPEPEYLEMDGPMDTRPPRGEVVPDNSLVELTYTVRVQFRVEDGGTMRNIGRAFKDIVSDANTRKELDAEDVVVEFSHGSVLD